MKTATKILKWLSLSIFMLIIIAVLFLYLLQTSWGSNQVRKITQRWLSNKLKTELTIGGLELGGYHNIRLYRLSVMDQKKDTLLVVDSLAVTLNLTRLLNKELVLSSINISNLDGRIHRLQSDTFFNYQFILDAFAKSSTEQDISQKSSWGFKINELALNQISIDYDDQYTGDRYDVGLGALRLALSKSDFSSLNFQVSSGRIDSLQAAIRMGKHQEESPGPEESDAGNALQIAADLLSLSRISVSFENTADNFRFNTNIHQLTGEQLRYDLSSSSATAHLIALDRHQTEINYRSTGTQSEVKDKKTKPAGSNPFRFSVDSFSVVKNSVLISDGASEVLPKGTFDPHHLQIDSLELLASGLKYDGFSYQATVRNLSFREKNGFVLNQLRSELHYSDTAVSVTGLVLSTPHNAILGEISAHYPGISNLMKEPQQTKLEVSLLPSKIRLDDWASFAPSLRQNKQLRSMLDKEFKVNVRASGTLEYLKLASFQIQEGGNSIRGSANLSHITKPEFLSGALQLQELKSSRKDLRELLPPGLIPDSAWSYIPERFMLKGTIDGSSQSIHSNVSLSSDIGQIVLKGYVKQFKDKDNALYDLEIRATNLALDNILKNPDYGELTADASIHGQGFDPSKAVASADVSVLEAFFQGYGYHNATLIATAEKGNISGTVHANDPNADLDARFGFHYGKKISHLSTQTDIRNLDLHALGFSDSLFAVHGSLQADIPVIDSADLEGEITITELKAQVGARNFSLDSLEVRAFVEKDTQYIRLRSDVADMDLDGRFSLAAIPGAARTVFQNYLVTSNQKKPFSEDIFLKFYLNAHVPDSLLGIIPGLKKLSPFSAKGKIDTRSNALMFLATINQLQYADYMLDSIRLVFLDDSSSVRYDKAQFGVIIEQITAPTFTVQKTILGCDIEKGLVKGNFAIIEPQKRIRYLLPFSYVNDPNRAYFSLQDTIILNQTRWNVNADNRLYVDFQKLNGSNLILQSGEESLSVRSNDAASDGFPLTIQAHSFQLESITGMFIGDNKILEGELDGTFILEKLKPFSFTSQTALNGLSIVGIRFGDLKAVVNNPDGKRMDADISLKGEGNDVAFKGWYTPSIGSMDFDLSLQPLQLRPAGIFLETFVDSLKGTLSGNLHASGTFKEPMIRGRLEFDTSFLIARQTGTPLLIGRAAFLFEGREILFDGMDLYDSAGRPAKLTGFVKVENFGNAEYDLELRSNKFLVSGKKRYPDQLVSGPIYTRLMLKIKGDLTKTNVDGNVDILDSSMINYVYSRAKKGPESDGLIEFFDPAKPLAADNSLSAATKPKKSPFNLSVNTYISLTPKSTVSILLDELTGDGLRAQGTANLNYSMSSTGGIQLVGNYLAESGKYDLTIAGLLKKEFELQKGSTIDWTGDLLNANANLSAMYKLKTDAEELVKDMSTQPGASRQKYDFEVFLFMKGKLLKPDISFRLDMPEKEQSAMDGIVYTRLKQVNTIPSELNKQVMGLLALNSFIADNPFSSLQGSGSGWETQAFSTAGRLLTQELNDFLGEVVKDVDIDVGLDIRDDYSSGKAQRRSDLKVGFAKSFANNRLNIYVGNSFALENQNQDIDLMSGLAGDVNFEYLLTSDGRYRLKGFRQSANDITFNGTVVETGMTFVVVVEFNKLKNAFKTRKKKRQSRYE